MTEIFKIIYQFLKWISALTGLTYREVNIVVYFILIPSLFFYLISRIIKQKWVILGYLIFVGISLLIIPDFEQFSSAFFDLSVDFLNCFEVIGLDYIQASVLICVLLPILIIFFLLKLNRKKKPKS